MGPCINQSYTNMGQSSDPSSSVGFCQAISGSDGRVSVGTLFRHEGTRCGSTDHLTVLYWCTIDIRTPTRGTHSVPTVSHGHSEALWGSGRRPAAFLRPQLTTVYQ